MPAGRRVPSRGHPVRIPTTGDDPCTTRPVPGAFACPFLPESPCHDPLHPHRRLLASPERARRRPREARRGPAAGHRLGAARVREVPDRPTGRRGLAAHLPRRACAAARPGGPSGHSLARRGRAHPLGAAGVPAPGRRQGALAREPRGAALGGPDGAGRALPARARPALRGVRAARGRGPHRLRQPRGRPRGWCTGCRRRSLPVSCTSRCAWTPPTGAPGGAGAASPRGAVLHPDAPRAPARLRPPVRGEGVSLSADLGVRLERRSPPRRPRPRRGAGGGGGDRRAGARRSSSSHS